jgi:hypothetical protein
VPIRELKEEKKPRNDQLEERLLRLLQVSTDTPELQRIWKNGVDVCSTTPDVSVFDLPMTAQDTETHSTKVQRGKGKIEGKMSSRSERTITKNGRM